MSEHNGLRIPIGDIESLPIASLLMACGLLGRKG
jgi:hypothetical protein